MDPRSEINNPDVPEVGSPAGVWVSLSHSRLPFPFAERRLLLMGLDLLAVNGALLLSLALRSQHGLDWGSLIQHPLWFLLLSALWLPLAHAFDAYDLRVAGRFRAAAPAML